MTNSLMLESRYLGIFTVPRIILCPQWQINVYICQMSKSVKDYKDGNKTQQGARLAKHDLVNSKNALRTNLNYQQEKVKPSGKKELRFVSLKQEGCLE